MINSDAERADAYLHGLLPEWEVAEFERDLARDAELTAVLETARRRLALLEAALPPAEADERLIQKTLYRIDERERRRSRRRKRIFYAIFTPLAVAMMTIGMFHVHYDNLSASPAKLEVFGQNQMIPGSHGAFRVRLTDGKTNAPIANVPVDVSLGEPGTATFAHLATFTTDARGNGQPSFDWPDWADGSYTLRVSAQTARTPETLTQQVSLKRSSRMIVTTDKPVYQPGQTIHIRTLSLRKPDLKPIANGPATIWVSDRKGNVIFRKQTPTSRFGITAADCPLAQELIEGPYSIHARIGDTESSVSVDVFSYILPKIQVRIIPDRTWYSPGEPIRGRIVANYVHGEPVAQAEWRLHASDRLAGGTVPEITGRTDSNGTAKFLVPALANGIAGNANGSELTVTVRDTGGQEQVAGMTVPISAQPILFDVISESDLIVRGVKNRIFISAHAPDGQPARVKGTATVQGLAGNQVVHEFATSELGVASIEIIPVDNEVSIRLTATDTAGRATERQIVLANLSHHDFLVRTDRAVYHGGDAMKVSVLGSGVEPVFLDILKDGQTVHSSMIEIHSGQGEQTIDLKPELSGALQLYTYRFDATGTAARKLRMVFVKPASMVTVSAKPDRVEYRPGDKARIVLTLTNSLGQPIPGAISLSAVDEAVFAVTKAQPGSDKPYPSLEAELLKPVLQAVFQSTADLGKNGADRLQFEQSVFAQTARSLNVAPMRSAKAAIMDSSVAEPHSLKGDSFKIKSRDVEHERLVGLGWVRTSWGVFFVLVGLIIYAASWIYVRWVYQVAAHLIGLLGLMCVCATQIGGCSDAPFGVKRSAEFAMLDKAPAAGMAMPLANGSAPPGMAPSVVRTRERFPETMLWVPELITDDTGKGALEVELPDSITTWRLSGSAVTAGGDLGSLQSSIRVFQPFFVDWNLPLSLTRNDECELPAVVSNFQTTPQTVELTMSRGPGFDIIGAEVQTVTLKPKEVRSVPFRIRALRVGRLDLTLTAKTATLSDAVKRSLEVLADGRRVETVANGTLSAPAQITLDVPQDAIEGSVHGMVRIYPSAFSQLIPGLDGIFKLPTGCFEQTSSALYPNVLALEYLRQIGKNAPQVEAKARQYIHVGYQRLLTFEVAGGGFDWYGHPPANLMLSAYGLMEFRDMARVHDVDAAMIDRTRRWLLSRRESDGSWYASPHVGRPLRPDEDRLRTTAYVAWAVFDGSAIEASTTRAFLLRHPPEKIQDPYILALVALALNTIDGNTSAAMPYFARLDTLKRSSSDSAKVWWELPPGAITAFYGAGPTGNIEATAMATLAFLKSGSDPALVQRSLRWLAEQQNADGIWGSTQATVLTLKAMLRGKDNVAGDGHRTVEISVDGQRFQTIEIPADQHDVMKQIDLSPVLKPGAHHVSLNHPSGNRIGYQVAMRYHVPDSNPAESKKLFVIDWKSTASSVVVHDVVTARATIINQMDHAASMVIAELPVPTGFVMEGSPSASISKVIDRHEPIASGVRLYLRELVPNQPLVISYRLRAVVPAMTTVPPGRVYEYYNPANAGFSAPSRSKMTVNGRKAELE